MKPQAPLVSMTQWRRNNEQQSRSADAHQEQAELVQGDAQQSHDEVDEATRRSKEEVDRRLEERIKHLEYGQAELEAQKEASVSELEILLAYKKRLEEALTACTEPLSITLRCMQQREGRLGQDLVYDPVSRALENEENTIRQSQAKLRHSLSDAVEQVRLLRAANYALDQELAGKEHALDIDRHCAVLNQSSPELTLYHQKPSCRSSSLQEWNHHTRHNIASSCHQVQRSRQLRSTVDLELQQVQENIQQHCACTDQAFNRRILETKEAKAKLENELAESTRQANVDRSMLTQLEEPLARIRDHLRLATTRLSQRAYRPGVEQCRDDVELKLHEEMAELSKNEDRLRRQQDQVEASLRCLRRSMEQLTEELNKKINSLMIDEVQCMTQRLSINYHAY